jgi:hypothetical protein
VPVPHFGLCLEEKDFHELAKSEHASICVCVCARACVRCVYEEKDLHELAKSEHASMCVCVCVCMCI